MTALVKRKAVLWQASDWGGVVVAAPRTDWGSELLRKIDSLSKLAPGWDGRHSPPPTPEALEQTRAVILEAAADPSFPRPHVGPVPGGGLQVEWTSDGFEVEVEVLPDGALMYLVSGPGREDFGSLRGAGSVRQLRARLRG